MDTDLPGEISQARARVRAWIALRVPPEWLDNDLDDRQQQGQLSRKWRSLLDEGGWIGASWPTKYGGMGLSYLESVAVWDELYRLPLPVLHESLGEVLVGPTLLAWGTEQQKRRHLPRIIDGTELWCQGFSEPGSGSDLASVKTRAVLTKHGWRITGSKIWTSGADEADWMFLLVRTNPAATRHAGLSFLLMPMNQPNVEIRPIHRLDGTAGFCEVFLDEANCDQDNLVGQLDDGWQVAMTTLAHERGTSSTSNYWRFKRELAVVASEYRSLGHADELIRSQLAEAWSMVEVIGGNRLRLLAAASGGTTDRSAAVLQAANKLIWTEYHQTLTELRMRILGLQGLTLDIGSDDGRTHLSAAQTDFFFARSETIWGGTSEIQRNILGERVLGLPR